MELRIGSVVRATAGRDKGGFFVILALEDGVPVICDGKRRSLEHPKRKNPRHLAMTATILPDSSMKTNREIRKALRPFYGPAIQREEVM